MPRRETKEHLLSNRITSHLWKEGIISSKQSQERCAAKLEVLLMAEAQLEAKLNAEAKELLEKYEKTTDRNPIDSRKMLVMIKKKLIQDRKLLLWSDPTLSPDDKINHLAHVMQQGILRDQEITVLVAETRLLQAIKQSITSQIKREEEVQALVRERLATKSVIEGSEEWDLLYQKAYTEISTKRGI